MNGIVSGSLTDGHKLPPEVQLAEMFSVSRSTIREALRSLASAGLIEKIPGATGGSFVRRLDAQRFGAQIADLMDLLIKVGTAERDDVIAVRAMLEIPACRLAAENRTDQHLEALRSILHAERSTSVEAPDVPELDISFHGTIAAASGNTVLGSLVHALHSVTDPVRSVELSEEAGRQTVRQHSDIVQAIADRDPDAAETAIRAHLDYLEQLRSREFQSTSASKR
ncbi:MAG: FadR family transcriptional regulator [Actinomycetota bacterium]|nr:FadR family transcriptional regulator [Actinomycetota bacterium]